MTTITLPTLPHRTPDNQYVRDLVTRMTTDWIDEQFDALLNHVSTLGNDPAAWIAAVRWHNELVSHYATHSSRISLTFRQATDNAEATAENQRLNRELTPAFHRRDIEFTRAVMASPCVDALSAEFGSVFTDQLRSELITNDPVNIELRSEVSDIIMRHQAIFGAATVEVRGETLPWSYVRKGMSDPDREARHATRDSMVATMRAAAPELQKLYDEALTRRLQMARNLNLDSYIELRSLEMGRTDWGPADARAFRDAVHAHVVPVASDLLRIQARQHGAELLDPADLQIWPDNPSPKLEVEVDEQLAAAARAFDAIGPEFGDPFRTLIDEQLVDLPARPGKGNGAFCTTFSDQRVPYLFCNSVGTPEDVRTLIHEYGHGLQQWRSRDIELVALRWPTLEACEIHSMALELLSLPHLHEFFGKEGGADFALEHVRDTLLALPYMAAIDEFQHEIYDPTRTAPPNADERGHIWRELTDRYRPGIDWASDPWWHDNRWLAQLHIFHQPFYYLDYALARTVSWQLWLRSLTDRDGALQAYLNLCSAGGTAPFRTLVRDAGLDDPFDPAVVERTMRDLRPHLGLDD